MNVRCVRVTGLAETNPAILSDAPERQTIHASGRVHPPAKPHRTAARHRRILHSPERQPVGRSRRTGRLRVRALSPRRPMPVSSARSHLDERADDHAHHRVQKRVAYHPDHQARLAEMLFAAHLDVSTRRTVRWPTPTRSRRSCRKSCSPTSMPRPSPSQTSSSPATCHAKRARNSGGTGPTRCGSGTRARSHRSVPRTPRAHPNLTDHEPLTRQCVERAPKSMGPGLVAGIEAHHLAERVNACVGSTRPHGLDRASQHRRERGFQTTLDGVEPRLPGETRERRALVGDGQRDGVRCLHRSSICHRLPSYAYRRERRQRSRHRPA